MKRYIHANTAIKDAESVFKDIADYIQSNELGYSDNNTWIDRITEGGYIEYITIDDVKEAMNENAEYYSEDPVSVFFDYAHLITSSNKCIDYAKKHGFLADYASYSRILRRL